MTNEYLHIRQAMLPIPQHANALCDMPLFKCNQKFISQSLSFAGIFSSLPLEFIFWLSLWPSIIGLTCGAIRKLGDFSETWIDLESLEESSSLGFLFLHVFFLEYQVMDVDVHNYVYKLVHLLFTQCNSLEWHFCRFHSYTAQNKALVSFYNRKHKIIACLAEFNGVVDVVTGNLE